MFLVVQLIVSPVRPFLRLQLNILISKVALGLTVVLSFGHCVFCPLSIYGF
jgi:hypothetical protein